MNVDAAPTNLDPATVAGFGEQWTVFDQSGVPEESLKHEFDEYFEIFRWDLINKQSVGFDMGCGTGRWAKLLAPHVGHLHCIEPSRALDVAKRKLANTPNVSFHSAGVGNAPLPPMSMDFGYVLGVLHYVPDPIAGLKACVELLKPSAPLLLYVYYRFENRPLWFRGIWRASDILRRGIARLPFTLRKAVTTTIAAMVYWPFARASRLLERRGVDVSNIPLSAHRNENFYYLKTLSLDRFGNRIEHRFSKAEVTQMLQDAGCEDIRFSSRCFWAVSAVRKSQ